MKEKRQMLTLSEKNQAASLFADRLLAAHLIPLAPQKIGVYMAHQGELDLIIAIERLRKQGHRLYLPIIQKNNLNFAFFSENCPLSTNQYGILEPELQKKSCLPPQLKDTDTDSMLELSFLPAQTALLSPLELDIVLVPLVAFDHEKNRLGWGKGYYDRAFAKKNQTPLLIGCAYTFQEVESLTPKKHDIKMDIIISV